MPVCLTEEELNLVERMRADIEAETGFRISRNQLIKKLLFGAWGHHFSLTLTNVPHPPIN
jgi:hypothetical protein